jgi:hypothetical protein
MSYKHNKKWRLKNPKKRNKERKRYYRKTQNSLNSGKRWTDEDVDQIIMPKKLDTKLAVELGRSVEAIQVRRCKFWGWIKKWQPSR